MIYPGEMEVSVDLDPEAMGCSDVTADDTSCTAMITSNDNYTVSLNVTNDLSSVVTVMTFDCEFIPMYTHSLVEAAHLCINMYKRQSDASKAVSNETWHWQCVHAVT